MLHCHRANKERHESGEAQHFVPNEVRLRFDIEHANETQPHRLLVPPSALCQFQLSVALVVGETASVPSLSTGSDLRLFYLHTESNISLDLGRVAMKKYGHLSLVAGLVLIGIPVTLSSTTSMNATQSYSSSGSLGMKVTLDVGCMGRSDYPHISAHVSRTVNVIAETICPGRKVSVRTTLSRRGWPFFREMASVSKSGMGSVRVNVAMKCKWKTGESPIEYVVESVHRDQTGASGVTRLHRFLKC